LKLLRALQLVVALGAPLSIEWGVAVYTVVLPRGSMVRARINREARFMLLAANPGPRFIPGQARAVGPGGPRPG